MLKNINNVDEKLKDEVAFLVRNRHPSILCVYGHCTDIGQECILTEYYPEGSYSDYQRKIKQKKKLPLDLKTKYHILLQATAGVVYLHKQNMNR
eukprot:UN15859